LEDDDHDLDHDHDHDLDQQYGRDVNAVNNRVKDFLSSNGVVVLLLLLLLVMENDGHDDDDDDVDGVIHFLRRGFLVRIHPILPF